jgi:hypothetical protein
MDLARIMAGGLALNRIAFGLNYVLRPQSAASTWIGRTAKQPATQVMTRSQGIRDVALGGGALLALARGEAGEARVWVAAHALSDATDLAATWLARDRLPRRSARLALGVAGASTAVAAAAAAGVRPARPAPAPAVPTAPVAAASLIGGYLVARETGIRPLGGVVLAAGGAWCTRAWARAGGPATAAGLLAVYLAGFGASHPLAKRVGAWPSVLGVAAASAGAAWALVDRRA